MKKFNLLAVSFIFATVFAMSTFAQTGTGKIGWIDTGMFADEKEGVTKYINALKALQTEMKPRLTELQTLDTRIKTIADELAKAQNNPAVPVKQETLIAKQEEGQKLQRELEFKKKDYDATLAKRGSEVLGPIQNDIFKAIQAFAKKNGYTAILDIQALANENINAILALDETANVTKAFITSYNAGGTTATTATPK